MFKELYKMSRKTYISNSIISLVEYLEIDNIDNYNDWLDKDTQRGFNLEMKYTFGEFLTDGPKNRLISAILLLSKNSIIGNIAISPLGTIPDLAVKIYKPYRNQGFGSMAFFLGTKYAIEHLQLVEIHAGCYSSNIASKKIIERCGYTRNPQGNLKEKHFITGEDILQLDYVYRQK